MLFDGHSSFGLYKVKIGIIELVHLCFFFPLIGNLLIRIEEEITK